MTEQAQQKEAGDKPGPSFLSILQTTFAAALGVQKKSKLEQDFNQKSPFPFIIAGILFTFCFVMVLVVGVNIVL